VEYPIARRGGAGAAGVAPFGVPREDKIAQRFWPTAASVACACKIHFKIKHLNGVAIATIMDIVKVAREYAVAEIEKYGQTPEEFLMLPEKKAVELAKRLKADVTVTQVGFYLMDLKLGQALTEKRLPEHVQMSIDAASAFLDDRKVGKKDKEKIINCIAAHHKTIPFTCIEAEICANADCLKFIHPRGFFMYLALLGGGILTSLRISKKRRRSSTRSGTSSRLTSARRSSSRTIEHSSNSAQMLATSDHQHLARDDNL
jgi:hypothetical protein